MPMSDAPPPPAPPPANPEGPAPSAPTHLPLDLPASLEPVYTNFALISHSPSEFIFDFARALPNMRARIVARLVMTPLNAKLLLRALAENVARYEAQNGEIVVPTQLADQLFKPPKPE
jgi:hypothetical protein